MLISVAKVSTFIYSWVLFNLLDIFFIKLHLLLKIKEGLKNNYTIKLHIGLPWRRVNKKLKDHYFLFFHRIPYKNLKILKIATTGVYLTLVPIFPETA